MFSFYSVITVPEWAIHCTENPDVTVQYISDSGAVQLSRRCNDSLKEISCQTKANQMDMYNALKCPEEEILSTISSLTSLSTEEITVETSSKLDTQVTASTTLKADEEEIQPKVIIKNPQKMMEDIFDTIDVNVDVDSNRLDDSDPHKMDLDLMVGDQPMPEEEADKKILLKLTDKKEAFKKKSDKIKEKLKAKDDDEMMMGDAPAEDITSTTENSEISTSPKHDANLIAEATTQTINDMSTFITSNDASTTEESSSISTESPQQSTEQNIPTTSTEEPTTKIIVQGHPLHMSQAIFKEPIQPDVNNTHERINFSDSDVFIPPMLLVKAKFTTTTSTGTEHSTMSDVIVTSSSAVSSPESADNTENVDAESTTIVESTTIKPENNEISSLNDTAQATQVENTITTVESSEKPIMVGKRTDPRLGLKDAMMSASTTTIVASTTEQMTTVISSEIPSSTTESEELTTTTEENSSSSGSSISSSTFEITAESSPSSTLIIDETENTEIATTTLQASNGSPEKLIADLSTTTIITSPSQTSEIPTSTAMMRNDIDAYHHQNGDVSDFSEHIETEGEGESSEDDHHHLENNFSNADYQPFKPNRHRTLSKQDHHHGPGFSIGKILG